MHRTATPDFAPTDKTRIGSTTAFAYTDELPPAGKQYYAIVAECLDERSLPAWASVEIPQAAPPAAPPDLEARAEPGQVVLDWLSPGPRARYHVYRAAEGSSDRRRMTAEPISQQTYADNLGPDTARYSYSVSAVGPRGVEGPACPPVTSAALAIRKEPIFTAPLASGAAMADSGTKLARAITPAEAAAAAKKTPLSKNAADEAWKKSLIGRDKLR